MLHPNEIVITPENYEVLLAEATAMGPSYVAALKEQANRQKQAPN